MSVSKKLQVNSFEYVGTSNAPPIQLLPNNPDRVWLTINVASLSGSVFLSQLGDGLQDGSFFGTSAVGWVNWLRKDVGSLVTQNVYVGDGAGNDIIGTLIVTEGVLVGV